MLLFNAYLVKPIPLIQLFSVFHIVLKCHILVIDVIKSEHTHTMIIQHFQLYQFFKFILCCYSVMDNSVLDVPVPHVHIGTLVMI